MALDIEERIRQINARLKAGKVGVSVQQRGDRLCLRGTLPPRPNSTKDKPFRQEIYLGVYCNPAGFNYAENEAKLVGSLLAKREFSWEPYLQTKRSQPQSFIAQLLNLWDKYVEHRASSVSITTLNKDFKKVRNHLVALVELDLENAIALRDRLLATKTANTSRRVLVQLNACCKWAVERAILESNPFEGMASKIKVAKSEADEIDPFDRAEIAAIVRGFERDRYFKHYTPFVKFLFMTGCRTSEAIGLQWKHVSNDLSIILFEEAVVDGHRKGLKTRKRKFPGDEKLRELLLSLRPDNPIPDSPVFVSPRGKLIDAHNFLNRAWKSVLLKEGIRYRCQYQTRHTFITHCIEKNIPILQIARWVGNSARIILERYAGVIEKYQVPSIL